MLDRFPGVGDGADDLGDVADHELDDDFDPGKVSGFSVRVSRRGGGGSRGIGDSNDWEGLEEPIKKTTFRETAEAEGFTPGTYQLYALSEETNGLPYRKLWTLEIEGDDQGGDRDAASVEQAVERAIDRKFGGGGGGKTVEGVLASRLDAALEAGNVHEASILSEEYLKLQQQQASSLLDQVQLEDSGIDLRTAMLLESGQSLTGGDGRKWRNLGRNLREAREGFTEGADADMGEMHGALSGLRALAEGYEEEPRGKGGDRGQRPRERPEQRAEQPATPEQRPEQQPEQQPARTTRERTGSDVGVIGVDEPGDAGDADDTAAAAADGGESPGQCTATTKAGDRCSRPAAPGGELCPQHERLRSGGDVGGDDDEARAREFVSGVGEVVDDGDADAADEEGDSDADAEIRADGGRIAYSQMDDGQLEQLSNNGDRRARELLREREQERRERERQQEERRIEQERRRWIRDQDIEFLRKIANHTRIQHAEEIWRAIRERGGDWQDKRRIAERAAEELRRRGVAVEFDDGDDDEGLTDEQIERAKREFWSLDRDDLLSVAGGELEPVPAEIWQIGDLRKSQMTALAAEVRDEREEQRQRVQQARQTRRGAIAPGRPRTSTGSACSR